MDIKPTAGLRDLFEAVHGDEDDAVVRLLRAGAPAEATDEEGTTVLYAAAVGDRAGAVRLLLAAGADPDRPSGPGGPGGPGGGDGTGDLPLCAAAVGGHTDVARALLAAGARPDLREAYGFTALVWAAGRGHAGVAEVLLAHGADPDLPGPSGEPPLVLAARRGSPATVRVLLRHRAAAREAALEEAGRWLESDLEVSLREGLKHTYGVCDGDEFALRRISEEGGTTVVAELLRDGVPIAAAEQQSGHAAVVTRLEAVLGIATSAAELAERAVRSRSPLSNDWRESVAVLWQRADAETLRAARSWCGRSASSLHQTFAADTLARAAPAAAAVPLLRDLAARPGPAHLTRAAVRALGRHGDPAALSQVLAHVTHPDAEVRHRVAESLGRLGLTAEERGAGRPEHAGEPGAVVPGAERAVPGAERTERDHDEDPDQEHRAAPGQGSPGFPAAPASPAAPGGPRAPAVAALLHLARDPVPAVRYAAVVALARAGGDSAAVRDALAEQVAEGTDPAGAGYAEAARGLAVRQDPRAAGALLRVLADGAPEGPGRAVAVEALAHVRDERVRRRLAATFPRCR
ncbi:ankyrin repeat domain-containing protein [Streptomyces sp. NPDC004111]|uniref:ankyrin repeat domain-containing protein n=1 Tax=Streptomyces sp. NPDC004111 TaxID=3364690 RepID=UPI00369BE018